MKNENINERLNNMFNRSRGNKTIINALKSHEKNAMAYKITLVPLEGDGNFMTVLDTQYADITPLNRSFIVENLPMTTIGGREIIAKTALKGVVLLDYKGLATGDKIDKANAIAILGELNDKVSGTKTTVRLFIGKLNGESTDTVVAERRLIAKNGMILSENYSRTDGRQKNGKTPFIAKSKLFDSNGKLKEGWLVFDTNKINSASQGRQQEITLFADNVGDFSKALSDATFGESDLTFADKIMDANGKEFADKDNRVGNKACHMGSTAAKVGNVLIALCKDARMDGNGYVSATWVAEAVRKGLEEEGKDAKVFKNLISLVEGYGLQIRPLTVKAAALVVYEAYMELLTSRHSIYLIDANNPTKEQEEVFRFKLDKVWAAHQPAEVARRVEKALEGYDAIGIMTNATSKKWDLYGDLNFYKDAWDLRRTAESGLNVLSVAHYDGDRENFKGAKTNGQMLKCVMEAIHKGEEHTPGFEKAANNVISDIIKAEIDDIVTLAAHPERFDGSKSLDASYEPMTYQLLNPTDYIGNASVVKNLIKHRIDSVNTMLAYDSYHVIGQNGMLMADPAIKAIGKSLLKDYVDKDGRYVMEVFSPVANAYFKKKHIAPDDRNGIGIKNPSMGAREFVLIKYVSLKEMEKRAKKVAHSKLLIRAYRNFKEGGVFLSDSLEAIAWIAAGLDLDGDKIIFLFSTKNHRDLVSIVWGSKLKPRAVHIGTPNSKDNSHIAPLDIKMFSTYAGWNISNGNASVGVITNSYAIFTALRYWIATGNANAYNMAVKMFASLGAGGSKEFTSAIKIKNTNGLEVFETSETALEDFFNSIKEVSLVRDNVIAMLEDLDVLGRHNQELGIDAQKNFYVVFSEWIEKIKDFSVQKNAFDIEFFVRFNKTECCIFVADNLCYKMKNGQIEVNDIVCTEPKERGGYRYYIADCFTRARVYAANTAFAKLKELAQRVSNAMKAEASSLTSAGAIFALPKVSDDARVLIGETFRKVITMDQAWRQTREDLDERIKHTKKHLGKGLTKKLKADLDRGMRNTYADIIESLNNEVRMIFGQCGLTPYEMVKAMDAMMDISSKGKFLRPERFIAMAMEGETPDFKWKVPSDEADKLLGFDNKTVEVFSGVIIEDFEDDLEAPLMDGIYTVRADGDNVYLVRPYADFVKVPAIDKDVVILRGTAYSKEDAAAVEAALQPGSYMLLNIDASKHRAFLGTKDNPEAVAVDLGDKNSKKSNTLRGLNVTASTPTLFKNLFLKDVTGGTVTKKIVQNRPAVKKVWRNGKEETVEYYNYTIVLHK